jgi:hypothetical protein
LVSGSSGGGTAVAVSGFSLSTYFYSFICLLVQNTGWADDGAAAMTDCARRHRHDQRTWRKRND